MTMKMLLGQCRWLLKIRSCRLCCNTREKFTHILMRRFAQCVLVAGLLLLLLNITIHIVHHQKYYTKSPIHTQHISVRVANINFVKTILKHCENDIILLALVDTAFVDMALNFYLTSLQPHGIQNYLFIGVSSKSCRYLMHRNISCYKYAEDVAAEEDSEFNSVAFLRKTNLRTEMILDALLAGVTVIHSDVDVVFQQNPLPELASIQSDMALMWDNDNYNAGFLIIRPTKESILIYDHVRTITMEKPKINDQVALNMAINDCTSFGSCDISVLDISRYMNGLYYFEYYNHTFGGERPCRSCVVIHNNYIVSRSAKIYRFKENSMWINDEHEYYSSTEHKYLTFQLPLTESLTIENQGISLKNALIIGDILNRIVILPQFGCPDDLLRPCAMNSWFKMRDFDDFFSDTYRESTFLSHPLVPADVKKSIYVTYYITEKEGSHPESDKFNITAEFIIEHLTDERSAVLSLSRLDNVLIDLSNSTHNIEFHHKLEKALQSCDYRQLCAMTRQ